MKAVIDPAPLAPAATSCVGAIVYDDVGTRIPAGLRLHPLLLWMRLQVKHNKKVLGDSQQMVATASGSPA